MGLVIYCHEKIAHTFDKGCISLANNGIIESYDSRGSRTSAIIIFIYIAGKVGKGIWRSFMISALT